MPLHIPTLSGKSVVLTLWGDLASEGPAASELDDHSERRIILQITNCRVTDYNGGAKAEGRGVFWWLG